MLRFFRTKSDRYWHGPVNVFLCLQKSCSITVCNFDSGEALDLLHAINWINDLHFDNIDFFHDSKTKTRVKTFNKDVTKFGYVLLNCKCNFASQFIYCCVEFNRKQTNKVVYTLPSKQKKKKVVYTLSRIATFLANSYH